MMLNPAVKRRYPSRRTLIAGLVAVFGLSQPARALSERIQHDPYTGIAIGGFDPVSYFLDGHPVAGDPDYEISWAGAYWHFANPGNAAAFEDAPEIYAPAYGGHGVAGIAEGVPQPGDPRRFVIHKGRLFFFYDDADLAAFTKDPDGYVAAADAKWPQVEAKLAD